MMLFRLFLGTAMLTMGCRLFWLVLGGVGFVIGFDLAENVFYGQPHSVMLVIALFAGLAGALLAIFLQKIAIVVGGFFAGGYLLIAVMHEFGMSTGHYPWIFFIIGGLIGSVFMRILFGWSLIILSSVLGASLILKALHLGPQTARLLFIVLLVVGIIIQYGLVAQKPPPRRI